MAGGRVAGGLEAGQAGEVGKPGPRDQLGAEQQVEGTGS